MADTNATGGPKWVKEQIVAGLLHVRDCVEAFVEHEDEESHLSEAVTALGEVRNMLSALQLSGPARLTEEMQALCEDLAARSLSNPPEAAEALMLALIQLPDYLDELEAASTDVPLHLLPSINDLRGSRGAAPLTQAALLVPTSILAESEMPALQIQQSMERVARRTRRRFHRYLLQWFREDTSRQGLVDLGRLFHRLQRHIGEGIFHELFLVAEAVVEALLEGSIATDPGTTALIARMDRVLKPFATDPHAWPEADAKDLLSDLLSLIARCKSSSYRVNELRTLYGLEGEELVAQPVKTEAQRTIDESPAETVSSSPPDVDRAQPETEEPGVDVVEAQSANVPFSRIAPSFLDVFLAEARGEEQTIGEQFARWRQNQEDEVALTTLRRSFHTLKGSSRLVGAQRVGEFSRAMEMLLNRVIDRTLPVSPDVMAFMDDVVDALGKLIVAEAEGQPMDVAELISRAESLVLYFSSETGDLLSPRGEAKTAKVIPLPASGVGDDHRSEEVPAPEVLESGVSEEAAREPEEEILATEIPDEPESGGEIPATEIPRDAVPGEETSAVEIPEQAVVRAEIETTPAPESPLSEKAFLVPGPAGGDASERVDTGIASFALDQDLLGAFLDDGLTGASAAGPHVSPMVPSPPAEPQVQVRSDLLNRLVEHAKEISSYRARLGQHGSLMGFQLGELDRTVDRLQEQLLRLERETEAQIHHRCDRDPDSMAQDGKGFDAPELDRFSTLQQLYRSLAETVNDLVSRRALLRDLQGESETLLQQQAKIVNDLQDGLSRVRMAP